MQRQIASCVLENICENLFRCNRILSPQQVAQIQSDLIFCDMLQGQNFVAETKIFPKILQYTRRGVANGTSKNVGLGKILAGSRNLGSVFDKSRSLVFAWFLFTFFDVSLGFLTVLLQLVAGPVHME